MKNIEKLRKLEEEQRKQMQKRKKNLPDTK